MKLLVALFALSALLVPTACSGDDEPDEQAFCDALRRLDEGEEPLDGADTSSEEEQVEADRERFRRAADELDTLRAEAPEEIEDDVALLVDAVEAFVDGASIESVDTEEFTVAAARLDEYRTGTCEA